VHSERPVTYVEILATAFLRAARIDSGEPAKGGGRQIHTPVRVPVFFSIEHVA
jgi:hypothetical protein